MGALVLTIPIIRMNLKEARNNMTKEKWLDAVDQENQKAQYAYPEYLSPENWHVAKKAIMDMVKSVDEATEVYNLENKVK
jgi:hypothetical protein